MRSFWLLLLVVAGTACGGNGVATDPAALPDQSENAPAAADLATTIPAVSIALSSTAPSSTAPSSTAVEAHTPAYDVFLAAVADTLEGTRFDGAPFEDPEVFAATGLLFCERMVQGAAGEQVVVEYLSELAGGDATLADGDQLVLSGALMGAATETLCPQAAG